MAMRGWKGFCGAKKHKTNVIAAQSAGIGPERGLAPGEVAGWACVFGGFGEY
jgi:hypothetical protein